MSYLTNPYRYVSGTSELITDGSKDWVAKFDLQGNSVADSGGAAWCCITAEADTSESIWNSNAIGIAIHHNGAGWDSPVGHSYGGRIDEIYDGRMFSSGTTNYYYFLLEQVGTTINAKAYPTDADRTNDTNQIGVTISLTSFVEMTGLSYACFGDNRASLHTFNGSGDNFSVLQTGNINFSNDFSDASQWETPLSQPTINDAVAGQGNITYTTGDPTTQYWSRIGLS